MTLWRVHTVGEMPMKYYQPYPTPERAEVMRIHLSQVLGRELAVDPVEWPDPSPEVTG